VKKMKGTARKNVSASRAIERPLFLKLQTDFRIALGTRQIPTLRQTGHDEISIPRAAFGAAQQPRPIQERKVLRPCSARSPLRCNNRKQCLICGKTGGAARFRTGLWTLIHMEDMPSEDDLSAHVVVAERDKVALKKYVAEREARLARMWHQIASRLVRSPDQKKSPVRLLSNGA
jgi:hypothetical protein